MGYDGRIIKTTNGGTNWFAQSYGSRNDFYGTWFTDSENGVVVGWNGTILKTINGGITWTNHSVGESNYFHDCTFC